MAIRFGQTHERLRVGVTGVTGDVLDSTVMRVRLRVCLPGSPNAYPVEALALRRLNIWTPPRPLESRSIRAFQDLALADPDFGQPREVDLVLGADLYPDLVRPGMVIRGGLVAQNTVVGWTVTGKEQSDIYPAPITSGATQLSPSTENWHEALHGLLQKFWATEEVPPAIRQSPDDLACEALLKVEHRRDACGRYSVPLPLIPGAVEALGDNLDNARRSLRSVHRRMRMDPLFHAEYVRYMEEYVQLGHMRPLTAEELEASQPRPHYIPHHGIWQSSDGGRKLRVVFNASCPTSSGLSLNGALWSGPTLQNHLLTVICRWRRRAVAYCAYIKMMFRMVRVNREYTRFLRIVWKPSPDAPEEHFEIEVLPFGTSPAPYLALRSLKQLCVDEGEDYPEGVRAVEEELYVDDFLSGADSVGEAIQRRDQLIQLLRRGGFELKKWVSNCSQLIEDLPMKDRLRPEWRLLASEGPVNELGVRWNPLTDCLTFSPPSLNDSDRLTKRQVLSEIARLFDPAGWLAPAVVIAKIFMQDLWRLWLDWDTDLPENRARQWSTFRTSLQNVSNISVPRWFHWTPSSRVQLHAFADASQRVMAAAVYLRATSGPGDAVVTIAVAKTKLVSLKSLSNDNPARLRMTVPRLELRAALLAARLLRDLSRDLAVPPHDCYAWSDSSTVLHWLQSKDSLGNHLVDSYVSHIHEVLPRGQWRYVNTGDNPADVATRGSTPAKLACNRMWWSGPAWLSQPSAQWPTPPFASPATPQNCFATCLAQLDIADRFSDLDRLLRVLVRCRRFIRRRLHPHTPPLVPLTAVELHAEFLDCVRRSQKLTFGPELHELNQGRPVSKASALRVLCPFLDTSGIIRVGGRLADSGLPFDEKHPVILDGKCHLAGLVIDCAHTRALHGGFRVTYAHAMRRAWITRGRVQVKAHLRRCITCLRATSRTSTQMMAPLPAPRVTPAPPFSRCGVDYAGPFQILCSKGRGIRSTKGYVAVFVCLSTKAIHLELVGDLTTASFLGALTRFAGRRGDPSELWSDNATNFRGAQAELRQSLRAAELDWGVVADSLASKGTRWRFMPPFSPHFGGLWEAGVKSMKTHLRRVGGTKLLTYEEFSTLLVSIEAVLNSRPLGPVSGDPDDLNVLTPAHALIGRTLLSQPQPHASAVNLDLLTHWELVKGMRDQFWVRWSREYLNTLQQRQKWPRPRENYQIGDIVLIIDPTLLRSRGRWPIGRIIQTFSGSDQLVRVFRIRTELGEYVRPVTKLLRLPTTHTPPRPTQEVN